MSKCLAPGLLRKLQSTLLNLVPEPGTMYERQSPDGAQVLVKKKAKLSRDTQESNR
jgi:hypothetical protein